MFGRYVRWPCEQCGRRKVAYDRTETKIGPMRIGWPRIKTQYLTNETGQIVGNSTTSRTDREERTATFWRPVYKCSRCGWEKPFGWSGDFASAFKRN